MKDHKKLEDIKKLTKQCDEYLNGWKLAKANLENYKKNTEKRQQEFREFMAADLVLDILPVHNHFKESLKHIPDNDKKKDWVVGITHIKSQLDKFLKDRGVEEIKTVGEKFNPELHEAVSKRKDKNLESDIILEECSTGYIMNGKVIMAAKVIVSE